MKEKSQEENRQKEFQQVKAFNQYCENLGSIVIKYALKIARGDQEILKNNEEKFSKLRICLEEIRTSLTEKEFDFFEKKLSSYHNDFQSNYEILKRIRPTSSSKKAREEYEQKAINSAREFSDKEVGDIVKSIKFCYKLNQIPTEQPHSQEVFAVMSEDTPPSCIAAAKAEELILQTIAIREQRKASKAR